MMPASHRLLSAACWLLLALTFGTLTSCRPASQSGVTPTFTTEQLSEDQKFLPRIDAVVEHTLKRRQLNTRDHAAWQIVHALLAYGRDLQINHEGQLVPALDWILAGNRLEGWSPRIDSGPGIVVPVEEGSKAGQGHPDQWLGYLSQAGLPPTTPIRVGSQTRQFRDLLTRAQWDIRPGMEASWTLMALAVPEYWNIDQSWTNSTGDTWTPERVAEMEARAPVVGGACGGTHRLYALAIAVNAKLRTVNGATNQLTPGWQVAYARVREFKQLTRARFQNPDGTFSGNYYVKPGKVADVSDQIATTGHIFEFLVETMSDDELREPWFRAAAERLVTLMEQADDLPLDVGGLYHAAHGLKRYRERLTAIAQSS
jgi:hypothetical protein